MSILKACLIASLVLAALCAADCGQGGLPCASGTCHFPAYIQGCFTYATSTSCQQCQYNYVKNGDICTYSPGANTDCCKAYIYPSGDCQQCAEGLALVEGKCVEKKVVGCLIKEKAGTCVNCALEYSLFGGKCYKKIIGCGKYGANARCEGCEAKYDLLGGYCVPKGTGVDSTCKYPWVQGSAAGECSIPGCQSPSEYGCVKCQSGFRLLPDGGCKQGAIEGCNVYALDGFCQSCKRPFYTEYSGFCLAMGCSKINNQGKCQQCDTSRGFQMATEGYCRIINCLVTSEKECLICEKGFVEVLGKCLKQDPRKVCTVCAKGFYQTENNQCKPRQPGCLAYTRSKCSQCELNLYLTTSYTCSQKQPGCIYKDGLCLDCKTPFRRVGGQNRCFIEGCIDFNDAGCIKCRDPYQLTQTGLCTFDNCFEVTDGRCLKCSDGYQISHEGFCYKVDPYCKAYGFEGNCIECKLSYYLDKSTKSLKCVAENFGCNYIDGRCASCRAPFQYNSKTQSCQIDGCSKYFLGGCSSCNAGYDLRYNTCKLPFCLVSRLGNCVECDPNYIMKSDGTCVNKDEFCWKYDQNGNCVECAPEYYLSKLTGKCKVREPGCRYDNNDKCTTCDKPFYFDGIRCEIYGCMKLGLKGCEQCFYPMQTTKSGLCSVINCDRMDNDRCVSCKPGFTIAADNSCQRQDKNCMVYGQNGCNKCIKGYRIDESGICQYADEHCWDFSERGSCTNCDRLYFLNSFNKCQIKDSSCAAYCSGRCIECKNQYYIHRGLCYPNAKGCLKQANIKKCQKCDSGYKLDNNVCTPEITRLSWDSVNMDFWSGDDDQNVAISKDVFTVGKTNKFNLDASISKGKAKIIYSSVIKGRKSFQVDDQTQNDGWTPSDSTINQFIGVSVSKMQTFYALDIKYVSGSTLSKFAIEQSDDDKIYQRVGEFVVSKNIPGTVQTFYFTPVQSKSIRIVVLSGIPNIKFQFYYSNGQNIYQTTTTTTTTYIEQQTQSTILDSLKGGILETKQGCVDKQLCWMGLELCDAKQILGFSLLPNVSSKGTIDAVSLKYSVDGVKFECYNGCKDVVLDRGSYRLNPRVTASKLRVYPSKWTGQPSYSVSFEY